jgi:hypothetical protein
MYVVKRNYKIHTKREVIEMFTWDSMMQLKGMTYEEGMAWLAQTFEGEELEIFDEGDGDFTVYVGGCWCDEAIVVEFEDGYVARWYRAEAWG